MKKTILMLGTFDSKGKEFDYLYRELERRGADIIAMDVGIFEPVGSFPVRIAAQEVALAGGVPLEELRKKGDRGWAMKIMCLGARKIAVGLEAEHSIQGVIGMGEAEEHPLQPQPCRAFHWGSPRCVLLHWRQGIQGSMWVPRTLCCSRPLWISAG